MDHTRQPDFIYKHDNPYHDKLGQYADFVLRDLDGEALKGQWREKYFHRHAPTFLEIGSGYGDFMIDFCQTNQDKNFVGLDYKFKRSFQVARKLNELEIKNFCYLRARGERVNYLFNNSELDGIFYFFPDPWPKTRHHKKRLFQHFFLKDCWESIKPGGFLFVKTDHDGYADHMRQVIQEQNLYSLEYQTSDLWSEVLSDPDFSKRVPYLGDYKTKFEKIFISQGVKIKAFLLRSLKPNQETTPQHDLAFQPQMALTSPSSKQ